MTTDTDTTRTLTVNRSDWTGRTMDLTLLGDRTWEQEGMRLWLEYAGTAQLDEDWSIETYIIRGADWDADYPLGRVFREERGGQVWVNGVAMGLERGQYLGDDLEDVLIVCAAQLVAVTV